jgi:spore coat protein H
MPGSTLVGAGLLVALSVSAAPARLDSGGGGGSFDASYLPDRLYSTANGSGAVGGTAVTPPLVTSGQLIENTAHPPLLNSTREGMSEYRFDLANGSYLLTLQFAELVHNGPNLRRFSVLAEGRTLLADLDLYARWGRNYAVTYRFAVTVSDGQLNVEFPASLGLPTVSAISVQAARPDRRAPAVPAGVAALGGYQRNIVTWNDATEPDLAGWLVQRAAAPAGPFAPLTAAPVQASRLFDDAVAPFVAAHYQVAAVDVWGNRSAWSSTVTAAPLDATQTALPAYRLTIPPDQLALLQADTDADYVTADFSAAGLLYPDIGVRFRGGSTRDNMKKSWKVNFKRSLPFEGQDKLNLKSMSMDESLLSECLAAGQLAAMNVLTSACTFAHLDVNGEYAGVFSRLEEVEPPFFVARGIDPAGQLLEAEGPLYANFQPLTDYSEVWNDQSPNDDGYPALAALVQTINETPDADFARVIASVVNVDAWLDYHAVCTLLGDWDHVSHNFHIYRAPGSPLWEVVPKDFDQGFLRADLPLLHGTRTTPRQPLFTYNVLTTRLLAVPRYRQWFADKLAALLAADFTPARMDARIDALHAAIAFDTRRDVFKRGREENAGFLASPQVLKDFVVQRRAFVQAELPALRPGVAQPVVINEVLADNRSGLVNGAGLRSPWVEIHNPGATAQNLGGYTLSDDPAQPARWAFPAGTQVPAGGRLLVWLDGASVPGELHAPLQVRPAGQALALFAPGGELLDTIGWRALGPDQSIARRTDGAAIWGLQTVPTPRAANRGPR